MDIKKKELQYIQKIIKANKGNISIQIHGESMYPTLKHMQLVEVMPIDQFKKQIKKNDIIVYKKSKYHFTVHRVVHYIKIFNKKIYFTKGDNNNYIDRYVISHKNIIGVLVE